MVRRGFDSTSSDISLEEDIRGQLGHDFLRLLGGKSNAFVLGKDSVGTEGDSGGRKAFRKQVRLLMCVMPWNGVGSDRPPTWRKSTRSDYETVGELRLSCLHVDPRGR